MKTTFALSPEAQSRLRALVAAQGGQSAVARRCGMNRQSISRILAEAQDPGAMRLDAVARALNVTVDYILHGTGDLRQERSRNEVALVVASAEAFRLAIDALPVGKDIRARLGGHLDAHIAVLNALAGRA